MTVQEIESSGNILMVAGKRSLTLVRQSRLIESNVGSETTATLLCGALYNLLTHTPTLERLLAELRSTFSSRSSVTMAGLHDLPYLNAVLEESLRVYPPAAFSQARIVPRQGAIICGEAIPGGTSVGVPSLAAGLSDANWTEPHAFKPERWLGDEWVGDDRKAVQPFLVGPRNCLGKK
jgi:cytochrome P450